MLFNIGGAEILVIAMVALIAVGPEQLPGVLRRFGRFVAQARTMTAGIRDEFMSGLDEVKEVTDADAWFGKGTRDDPIVPRGYAKQREAEANANDEWGDDDPNPSRSDQAEPDSEKADQADRAEVDSEQPDEVDREKADPAEPAEVDREQADQADRVEVDSEQLDEADGEKAEMAAKADQADRAEADRADSDRADQAMSDDADRLKGNRADSEKPDAGDSASSGRHDVEPAARASGSNGASPTDAGERRATRSSSVTTTPTDSTDVSEPTGDTESQA